MRLGLAIKSALKGCNISHTIYHLQSDFVVALFTRSQWSVKGVIDNPLQRVVVERFPLSIYPEVVVINAREVIRNIESQAFSIGKSSTLFPISAHSGRNSICHDNHISNSTSAQISPTTTCVVATCRSVVSSAIFYRHKALCHKFKWHLCIK